MLSRVVVFYLGPAQCGTYSTSPILSLKYDFRRNAANWFLVEYAYARFCNRIVANKKTCSR